MVLPSKPGRTSYRHRFPVPLMGAAKAFTGVLCCSFYRRASLRICRKSATTSQSARVTEEGPDVTLYTAKSTFPAFNGWKMTILLEELQAAGKFGSGGFAVRELDLDRREHKEPWFLDINPNGRIPALVDHRHANLALFESGAIMQYLGEVYGNGFLLPLERDRRYAVLQWLFFQCAGVGPIQGQAHAFLRYVQCHRMYRMQRQDSKTRPADFTKC